MEKIFKSQLVQCSKVCNITKNGDYWSDIGGDTKIVAGGVGVEGDGGESGGGRDWLETSRGRSRVTQLQVLIVRKTCAVGSPKLGHI